MPIKEIQLVGRVCRHALHLHHPQPKENISISMVTLMMLLPKPQKQPHSDSMTLRCPLQYRSTIGNRQQDNPASSFS